MSLPLPTTTNCLLLRKKFATAARYLRCCNKRRKASPVKKFAAAVSYYHSRQAATDLHACDEDLKATKTVDEVFVDLKSVASEWRWVHLTHVWMLQDELLSLLCDCTFLQAQGFFPQWWRSDSFRPVSCALCQPSPNLVFNGFEIREHPVMSFVRNPRRTHADE